MTDTDLRMTPSLAAALLGLMLRKMDEHKDVVDKFTEIEVGTVLMAQQLLRDHLAGKVDLNTWAGGSAFTLIWHAVRALDTTGLAERIEREVAEDPEAAAAHAAEVSRRIEERASSTNA